MNWLFSFFRSLFGGSKPKPPVVPPVVPPVEPTYSFFIQIVDEENQPVPNTTVTITPDLDHTPIIMTSTATGNVAVVVSNHGLWETGADITYTVDGYYAVTERIILDASKKSVTLKKIPPFGGFAVDGRGFTQRGKPWKMKFATDFALLKRFIDGEDIGYLIDQRRSAGANGARVIGQVDWLNLYVTGPGYYTKVREFFAYTKAKEWAIEFVVFTGSSMMPDEGVQKSHFRQIVEIARDFDHVFLELSNEWNHPANNMKVSIFDRPSGVIASHGSGLGGAYPALPAWDYAGVHDPREGDWAEGVRLSLSVGADLKIPVVSGEPMGAHDVFQPGRRDNNPENFRRAGRILGWGPGACFHSEAGLRSQLWSPTQLACAVAFFQGFAEGEAGQSPRPAELDGIQAPQGGNSFGPQMPQTIQASIRLLAQKYTGLLNGDDDARRQLMGMIAEQARWCCGESWGWKRADNGRPLSKDAIAQQQPDGKLFAWDCFTGGIPRQVVVNPGVIDITGQVFVPVEPKNHIG